MQETIYKCDNCKKVIGAKKHLSIASDRYTGIATPPRDKVSSWYVTPFNPKFIHICSGKCAGVFFTEALKDKKKK